MTTKLDRRVRQLVSRTAALLASISLQSRTQRARPGALPLDAYVDVTTAGYAELTSCRQTDRWADSEDNCSEPGASTPNDSQIERLLMRRKE